MKILGSHGVRAETRNGPVLMMPEAVTTVYEQPEERVIFWPARDANPFFHLLEPIWMLSGSDKLEPLTYIVKRMASFSDDGGETQWAAYGHRWRVRFGKDQIQEIIQALRQNPNCRRQVLQMWSAQLDLERQGKDVPCNLVATFQISDNRLNMVVFCRSNDIIWGAYGANAVHFSFLLEYMARSIGVETGRYTQISVNWHAYLTLFENIETELEQMKDYTFCPYEDGTVKPFPIKIVDDARWDADLRRFMEIVHTGRTSSWSDPFFGDVAWPMMEAHRIYKTMDGEDKFLRSMLMLDNVRAGDWRLAAKEWIERRHKRWQQAQDDGPRPEGAL
jgi:hypothetical protein